MENIEKERSRILMQELRGYEKATPMTEEERSALRDWVEDGNSVHDNPAGTFLKNGRPMDFLDAYRENEEIRRAIEFMTYAEGTRYLREKYGIIRDEKPFTYRDMLKRIDQLYRTSVLCWEVLVANDLRDEAYEYIQEHFDEVLPFDDRYTLNLAEMKGGMHHG